MLTHDEAGNPKVIDMANASGSGQGSLKGSVRESQKLLSQKGSIRGSQKGSLLGSQKGSLLGSQKRSSGHRSLAEDEMGSKTGTTAIEEPVQEADNEESVL